MVRQFGILTSTGLRGISAALLGMVVAFAGTESAQAGIFLEIQQGDSVFTTAGSTSSFVGATSIDVGDYRISVVAGSSNLPGNSLNAIVELTELTVTRLTGNSAAPLAVRLLADSFLNPAGNPLYMQSRAEADFSNSGDGSTVDFISYFNTNNSSSFMAGAAADALGLTAGDGLESTTERVARLHPAFSLSNVTLIDLKSIGSSVSTSGVTVVGNHAFDTGSETIPNPEPASLVLLACGGLGLCGARLRNRKRQAC